MAIEEGLQGPTLSDRVRALEEKLAQVDRQSRCRHTWEPDRQDPHVWRCADCGAEDLKRH